MSLHALMNAVAGLSRPITHLMPAMTMLSVT